MPPPFQTTPPDQRPLGVVGLGLSGIAASRFLARQGHEVLAWDHNPQRGLDLQNEAGIHLSHEPEPAAALGSCREILLSPGIPRSHACLQQAMARGIPVINDVEWLYRQDQTRPDPAHFVGITGTNGKSTVTTLVGLMLKKSGLKTKTGGNLGQAALSLWDPQAQAYVLELSSFQLESLDHFRPRTAALLNLTPDHLDRYPTMEAYLAAKLRLFARQGAGDTALLNADEPALWEACRAIISPKTTLIPFSSRRPVAGGLAIVAGTLLDGREPGPAKPLFSLDRLKITGVHNQINALAAAAIALAAGATVAAVTETLVTFPGLPHRMEWIRTVGGIPFYNDSKGTNVGAVLHSLASFPNRVVWIAGGRDKKGDFSPLVPLVERYVSHTILLGEAASTMAPCFSHVSRVEQVSSMEEAVRLAHRRAQPGEAVLLSPACTSFDMFRSFEDRGDIFRKAVHEL